MRYLKFLSTAFAFLYDDGCAGNAIGLEPNEKTRGGKYGNIFCSSLSLNVLDLSSLALLAELKGALVSCGLAGRTPARNISPID